MTTFTLTGTFTHQNGTTPISKSPIHVHADPFPLGSTVQTDRVEKVTDANGTVTFTLTTGVTGLYYVVRSTAKRPLFKPIRFLAPAAGTVLNINSLIFYNPGDPPLEQDLIAIRDASLAAVSSVKIGTWQATTAYVADQTVQAPDGSLIKSLSTRTSRASFDATEQTSWTAVEAKTGTLAQVGVAAAVQHGTGSVFASNYTSVQAAVDSLAPFGGGVVRLPYGPTYVDSGGIHLTSRVTLAGPPVRHTSNQLSQVDGSGFLRPQGISASTGLASFDGAYLVPTAGSAGPMVWADEFARSYAIKDVAIFGVDVFGANITPPAKPAWATGKAAWVDSAASTTSGSTTVQLSGIQAMTQMVGKTVTATGVTAGTTVTAINAGLNQITLSANATATASGVSLTVSGGFVAPMMPQSGRPAISFGSGVGRNRTRSLIENVMTWGCGSGGPGSTANNTSWPVTGAVTSGSNLIALTSQPSPKMVTAPITGTGIPAGTTVVSIDPKNNIIALSANATATGGSVALTIGGSTFTPAVQQVYTGSPAVYLGSAEVVVRGLSCYYGGGDGLVIDNQDCHIDNDNLFGWNSGWGFRATLNSGPCRATGAIDSFFNGIYGGAGSYYIEGVDHRFFSLQSNTPGTEHIRFGRCFDSIVYYLDGDSAGVYWANSGTRYSGVNFAAPAASVSNPAWNDARNQGCQILGGRLSTSYGFEDHMVASTEAVPGIPVLLGLNMHSATVWNGGSPGNNVFALVPAYATNFRVFGCFNFPDSFTGAAGFGPSFLANASNDALDVIDTSGVQQAGFGPRGALFVRSNSQTLAANGAVTFDAQRGNIQIVTLSANATSSTISNPRTGQQMTIEWIQDGTGGRSYSWPTVCKFAGGAAPTASTSAGWADSVTFRFDGTNWREMSRCVGLH